MTVKDVIAKVLLWAIIGIKGIEGHLGGPGHGMYICGIKPWEPPDPGPWMGVCSSRICPFYEACLDKWGS